MTYIEGARYLPSLASVNNSSATRRRAAFVLYHSCPQERPQGELPRRPAQPRAQSSGSDAGGILFEPAIIDDSVFQGHPKPLVREV